MIECSHIKKVNFLINAKYCGISFKHDPNISNLAAKLTLEEAINSYSKNYQIKLNVCRYLYSDKNLLFEFDKKSPYNHPNLYLGTFNNFHVNLQLTHSKLYNFEELSTFDLVGVKKSQFISREIYVYSNYEQVFLNLNALAENDKLFEFLNYQEFLPKHKDTVKIENYINENKKELSKVINLSLKK